MTTQTEHAVMCPELEVLAAFIDGKLTGAERDAMVEHLASCEACYEVYTETLRIQEDLGPRAVPAAGKDDDRADLAPVVRHPRSFGSAWRAAAAVAAALVLAVGLLWYLSRSPVVPIAGVSPLMADLKEPELSILSNSDWYEHRWPRMRGFAPDLSLTDQGSDKTAFRLGVHAVDLEIALQLEQRYLAGLQTQQIETLLRQLTMWQFAVESYIDLRNKIPDAPPGELLAYSRQLESDLIEGDYPLVDRSYFFFGKWVEKSRLAALMGAGHYFGEDEYHGFLRSLEKAELGEKVSQKVKEVRTLVESQPIPREDLISALDEIIRLEGVG